MKNIDYQLKEYGLLLAYGIKEPKPLDELFFINLYENINKNIEKDDDELLSIIKNYIYSECCVMISDWNVFESNMKNVGIFELESVQNIFKSVRVKFTNTASRITFGLSTKEEKENFKNIEIIEKLSKGLQIKLTFNNNDKFVFEIKKEIITLFMKILIRLKIRTISNEDIPRLILKKYKRKQHEIV